MNNMSFAATLGIFIVLFLQIITVILVVGFIMMYRSANQVIPAVSDGLRYSPDDGITMNISRLYYNGTINLTNFREYIGIKMKTVAYDYRQDWQLLCAQNPDGVWDLIGVYQLNSTPVFAGGILKNITCD